MRIDGFVNAQATPGKGVPDILQKLKTGDTIKAKVVEAGQDEVTLRLSDGSTLKASLASDIGAKAGDVLTLSVTGRSEGSILLETVKSATVSLSAADGAVAAAADGSKEQLGKLLLNINITPDEQNLELAGEFKQAGSTPTKELFETAKSLLDKFSSISPDKAVYISMKGIDHVSGNIDTISQMLEGRLKLGEQMNNLQKSINSLINLSEGLAVNEMAESAAGINGNKSADTTAGSKTALADAAALGLTKGAEVDQTVAGKSTSAASNP
ncbi:MAG: hypothetical protein HGA22_09170, partial [Clostridiales bacterium]|nr:hypothetical protein [Clostridiales bacterium]